MGEPERFAELPEESRAFLAQLSREDIATIEAGLPILRMVIGFGKVARWIFITIVGVFVGGVMLGENLMKLIGWFRAPPS